MDIGVPLPSVDDIPEALPPVPFVPPNRQRYTLAEVHAVGGLGRVWLAHDDQMGRAVALKELRPDWASNSALRAGFLREARITGQSERVEREPDAPPRRWSPTLRQSSKRHAFSNSYKEAPSK
jgi:serine/threonine protein kinase